MLIPNARRAWRLWSVHVSAIGAVIFTVLLAAPDQVLAFWMALPPELQAMLPNAPQIGLFLSIAAIIARVIRQREKTDGK